MIEFGDDLVRICRFFGIFERTEVCCGDVSVPQCVLLQELQTHENDVSGLAAAAGVSLSAMTRLLDGLVKRGWAERRGDPSDRRRVVVGLTDAGAAKAAELREMTERSLGIVLAEIPPDKLPQVLDSLRVLRQALERVWGSLGCCASPTSATGEQATINREGSSTKR